MSRRHTAEGVFLGRKVQEENKIHPVKHALKFPQTHFRVKGSTDNLIPELLKFVDHDHMLEENQLASYDFMVRHLTKKMGSVDRKIPTVDAVRLKKRDSSPGEPWVSRFTTFQHLINGVCEEHQVDEEGALQIMADYCDWVEDLIVSGDESQETLQFSFYVHSKEDKYAPSKILSGAYRSIQGGDWVPQVIISKYCHLWSYQLKECVPEIVVKVGPEWDRRMARFWSKYTYASDITAFDRCVNRTLIRKFVDYLGVVTSMPVLLANCMFEMICSGSLILPDGRRMTRDGGNPSGMPLTAEMNAFIHFWMCLDVFSYHLKIEPDEVLNRLIFALCGDDELVGGNEEDIDKLKDTPEIFLNRWGFTVKQELYIKEGKEVSTFPPGFHAPFLDCTSIRVGGITLPLPVRPHRRLASLFYEPKDGAEYSEVVSGVFESMLPWIVRSGDGEQVPPCVEEFINIVREHRVGRSVVDVLAGFGIERGYGRV